MLPRSPAPAAAIALTKRLQFLVLFRRQFLVDPVEHDGSALSESPAEIPDTARLQGVGDLVDDPLERHTIELCFLPVQFVDNGGKTPGSILKDYVDLPHLLIGESDFLLDQIVFPPFAPTRTGGTLALARSL
jgi:hypothetical protein